MNESKRKKIIERSQTKDYIADYSVYMSDVRENEQHCATVIETSTAFAWGWGV